MLGAYESVASLAKRINVPITSASSPEQIAASQEDPWSKSGKYARGWVYFSILLLVITTVVRIYHLWGDKIRTGLYKEEILNASHNTSPGVEYELTSGCTDSSTKRFFPAHGPLLQERKQQSSISSIAPLNNTIAFMRWIFYRPIPVLKIWKFEVVFPSLGVTAIVLAALTFVTLYCFLPRPLYYPTIRYGSPPLAIRAGMIAVSMVPWIVALSTKANFITLLTGIGHERLNVLHRWAGYLCLLLSLVHIIPFYITPIWSDGALPIFQPYFPTNMYIYGSGVAAFVPLAFLCVHSLPVLRNWMYELFVFLHLPVAIVFVAMLFWHTRNFLSSWDYLWATVAIWLMSCFVRLFYLNWSNPFRLSWLIGEESAVTILPENAIKVTIPTQMKWKPGQYVYLRMPGISIFENHPFTIASLCSDDFPSSYGEEYRDMALVFRPFGGFTRKVLETALRKGPYKTYRAFLDGPYGGMQREMAAFNDVVFFAGGSGITAIASQLLDLIKKMRDGKAVTRSVRVIWALKRPETMEWFKEELRICREFAPPNSVQCQFYITAAKRKEPMTEPQARPHSGLMVHDRINEMFQGVASKRNSAFIREEAAGDQEREKELRRENEDAITELPQAYMVPPIAQHGRRHSYPLYSDPNFASQQPACNYNNYSPPPHHPAHAHNYNYNYNNNHNSFDFGFPSTPTILQKNLMRFAFLPMQKQDGWRTEYGRPDIPYMLKEFSKTFGRRACVFVCGPPSMRVEVANAVARLQQQVMMDPSKDEIFLHAENYAI